MMRRGWVETELGNVCEIISGKNQKNVENPNGKYPIYGSGGIFGYADEYLCDPGTTIIGRKGTINSPILVNQKFWNVDTAFGISPTFLISAKYIYYFCVGFNFKKLDKSTTIPSLAKRDLLKIGFPLAPLPEQRAIVAKMEKLFSDLDNGIANLKTAKAKLDIYRQAVLKKAFEGELTNVRGKIEVVQFGREVKIVSGSTPKNLGQVSNKGQFQFYKVSDMNTPGNEVEMKTSNLKLTDNEIRELKVKKFPKGTIIFPKRGGAILTNKKRILSEEASFDLNLMGVIPSENYSSKYLFYFFMHLDLGKICDGSAVPQINNKNIAPLDFPKCEPVVQTQIVMEIESRLSVCDKLAESIDQSLEKAEALHQSILKKAFEGKLLSEAELEACRREPDWEPADKLLERIKKDKAVGAKNATTGKRSGL